MIIMYIAITIMVILYNNNFKVYYFFEKVSVILAKNDSDYFSGKVVFFLLLFAIAIIVRIFLFGRLRIKKQKNVNMFAIMNLIIVFLFVAINKCIYNVEFQIGDILPFLFTNLVVVITEEIINRDIRMCIYSV